jgi:eukaryotic-like serine/threonine-protein kinase
MFPQIFGKYVLERELAAGGMARVFLATLRGAGGFEKRLCVKQIRPELASDQCFIERFVAEAQTTVDLSHANIVPVYELGAEQGTYYIAMELCAGVSLAELLRAGPATPSEGAYIGVEICRALDYAHRKAGVVHRDVTPRNVMIDPEGMVRVIDFGIAAPASAAGSGGLTFGSPGHMPPEQMRGGPLTPAADVFAVAALLVEVWTGRAPFRRDTFQASVEALAEPLPALGASHPALAPLEPLLVSALAHAASERPQTAEELARPLREFLRRDDLGDIARRLGQRVNERVRELARASREGTGRSRGAALAATGVTAATAAGDYGAPPPTAAILPVTDTATFAARDLLREWTAKIESVAPAPSPLHSDIDSGMTAPAPSRSLTRPGRRRVFAAGLALGTGALVALGFGAGRSAESAGAREPLAAAPVAPVAPPQTFEAVFPPTIASTLPPLPGQQAGTPQSTGEGGTPLTALSPSGTEHAEAPSSKARPSAARREPGGALRVPAPAPSASGALLPSSASPASRKLRAAASAAEIQPLARLQLTAEPAAWVELDAARIGLTPLMGHAAPAGRHTISFVSQLLGEKLETVITLDPATITRIHADFTSANPRVILR